MAYKVIQWATGSMGKSCLRATIDHPDLDLAVVDRDPADVRVSVNRAAGTGGRRRRPYKLAGDQSSVLGTAGGQLRRRRP